MHPVADAWLADLPPGAVVLADSAQAHLGPWVTVPLAAAASAQPVSTAHQHMLVLCAAGRLTQQPDGRFQIAAPHTVPPGVSDRSRRRIVAWYLHAADAAVRATGVGTRHTLLIEPAPNPPPPEPAGFAAGYAWMLREHENILAATHTAVDRELHQSAWQLALLVADSSALDTAVDRWTEAVKIGLAAAERAGDPVGTALMIESHGALYSRRGLVEQATVLQNRAAAIREQAGDHLGLARSANALGHLCLRGDQNDLAMVHFCRAERLARHHGSPHLAELARLNIAATLSRTGRFADAEVLLRACRAELAELNMPVDAAAAGGRLGRVLRGQGRLAEALKAMQAALAETASLGVGSFLAAPLVELATILTELERHDQAEDALRQAALLYRAIGDREHLAEVLHQAADLYRRAGNLDQAAQLHGHAQTLRAALHADGISSKPPLTTEDA